MQILTLRQLACTELGFNGTLNESANFISTEFCLCKNTCTKIQTMHSIIMHEIAQLF